MNMSETPQSSNQEYLLDGTVDLGNFNAQRRGGELAIAAAAQAGVEIAIDFAQLPAANSLTVALMIAWYRYAQAQGGVVRFINLPAALQQIVDFSGLGDVLPIAAATDAQYTGTAIGGSVNKFPI